MTGNVFSQNAINPGIQIKYVNPGISTIIAVDYRKFDSAFAKSMYRDTVFNNLSLIKKLKQDYAKVKYQKKYKRIDTRYKISLYYPNQTEPVLVYMSYYGDATINHRLLSQCDFLNTLNKLIDSLVKKKNS